MSSGTKINKSPCTTKPVLTISWLAWSKIWKLTENNKENGKFYECTSLGIMDPKDPCRLLDIFIPEQENTGSSTEVDDDDQMTWLAECVAKGIDPGQLVFWHHSHADMDVFWSSTDITNINRYDGDNIQWSMVTNANGKYKIRADLFSPLRYWWDDCDCEVEYPQIELDEWWDTVSPKVNNKRYTVTKHYTKKDVVKSGKSTKVIKPHYGNSWWGYDGTGFDDGESYYRYDWKNGRTDPVVDEPSSSKEDYPYEVLSHNRLQQAYDDELITHSEAMALEHSFLCDAISEESLLENIDKLEAVTLSRDLLGDEYEFATHEEEDVVETREDKRNVN